VSEHVLEVVLPEALHARPANMLVRLSNRQPGTVTLFLGGKKANGKKILEVLRLAAKHGDSVRIETSEASALAAIAELIGSGFASDALPEAGTAAAPGIAVGRASLVKAKGTGATAMDPSLAFELARREIETLLAELPPSEAQLFEPELAILVELESATMAKVAAGIAAGAALDLAADDAKTEQSDLVQDAHQRVRALLEGLEPVAVVLARAEGERVVLTDTLTPSLLLSLPRSVCGIVATEETGPGYTSHAAILARGRGLPLVFAPAHVLGQAAEDDRVVIESTGASARFWINPSPELTAEVLRRRDAQKAEEAEREARIAALPAGSTPVRVNVGAFDEAIPAAADGVGLLRTELGFAAHLRAPSAQEQADRYIGLLRRLAGRPLVVRLFDAGGDKPLSFLPAPADERGVALLFACEDVLRAQLEALDRARAHGDVRVLIPMVRSAADVERVRAGLASDIPVGAMIETVAAAESIDAIARVSDFVSIGTNDLAASLFGTDRMKDVLSRDDRLFELVVRISQGAHAAGRMVTVCGELAGDPEGAAWLLRAGVDALSVAASRVVRIKLAIAVPVGES